MLMVTLKKMIKMSDIFYHGSPHKFEQFDASRSHDGSGRIWVTKCRKMALSYATKSGWIYSVKLSDNCDSRVDCDGGGCLAVKMVDIDDIQILSVDKIDNEIKLPMWESECGRIVIRQAISREH